MKPTARLWLEERRKSLNQLPIEEERRVIRLKESTRNRDRLGQTPFSLHTAKGLLDQNVSLLASIERLEGLYKQGELERADQRDRLRELGDDNYRLKLRCTAMRRERDFVELLLQEQVQREGLRANEGDARIDLLLKIMGSELMTSGTSPTRNSIHRTATTVACRRPFPVSESFFRPERCWE
ncbi:hypothetical protein TRVL_09739 [Trypanosoma vivax]|nr:hypothetical protein TRVL_09739 [Trypanosoma vivax]